MKATDIEKKYNVKSIRAESKDDCSGCCSNKQGSIFICDDCLEDHEANIYTIFKDKIMDRDFREGDKVWFACEELTVTKVDKEINLINLSDKFNNLRFEGSSGNKDIHRDHDRKISAAVQKAIEENETKPVRKVKRWVNLFDFVPSPKQMFDIFDTEEQAIESAIVDNDKIKYSAIAQEIEVEEDKL